MKKLFIKSATQGTHRIFVARLDSHVQFFAALAVFSATGSESGESVSGTTCLFDTVHSLYHFFTANVPVFLHVAFCTLMPLQQPQFSFEVRAPLCLSPGRTGTFFAPTNLTLYADNPLMLGSLSSLLGRMQSLITCTRVRE